MRAENGTKLARGPDPELARIAASSFIDVHYHAEPDAYRRRHTALNAASIYAAQNGWVVLKNHLGCTAAQAVEGRRAGLPVSGSIVLNEIAGGISWRTVERSICQIGVADSRFIVHFPTVTGRPHQSRLSRELSSPILARAPIKPLTVSSPDGCLRPAVLEIMRMSCDYPLVISTGHASKEEVLRLVDAALSLGVPRLMLNQPANPMTGMTAEDLMQFAGEQSIYIEQCALTFLLGYQSEDDFSQVLRSVPNVVYSSDLGQPSQPDISQWLALSADWFKKFHLTAARVDEVVRLNPMRMLT